MKMLILFMLILSFPGVRDLEGKYAHSDKFGRKHSLHFYDNSKGQMEGEMAAVFYEGNEVFCYQGKVTNFTEYDSSFAFDLIQITVRKDSFGAEPKDLTPMDKDKRPFALNSDSLHFMGEQTDSGLKIGFMPWFSDSSIEYAHFDGL